MKLFIKITNRNTNLSKLINPSKYNFQQRQDMWAFYTYVAKNFTIEYTQVKGTA